MTNENSKLDAERAAFEAWMREEYAADDDMLQKPHEGRYFYAKPANMWASWQARAGLPVGVPDGIAEQHAKAMRLLREAHSRIIPKGNISVSIFERIGAFLDSAAALSAQQSDPWAPSEADYDRAIHANPDAKAWADLFVATFPGLADKHGLMIGWFANAMMAMHDHLKAQQSAPERVSVPVEFSKFSDKILAKLIRFADCAEDFEAGGVDIGRDWLDTLTHLGLLERVQRSPALWQTTDDADAIIEAQRALLASHGRPTAATEEGEV